MSSGNPKAPPPRGRQARSRAARAMVREHALRLFLRDGYDATTVETIAQTAGISRRTFFRYFQSKEDVVTTRTEELGLEFGQLYRTRPASESPLAAMRAAFQPIVTEYTRDPVRTRAILRLSLETPELRGRHRDVQASWIVAISAEVAARSPGQGTLFSDMLATIAIAALNVAVTRWLVDGGDLTALLDATFATMPAMLA